MSQFDSYGMSDTVIELRQKVRTFIDEKVIPVETIVEEGGDQGERVLKELQEQAKHEGIWALGLPKDIGGGGLKFMDYVYINEIVGRSEAAMFALGTHTAQDSTMLNMFGTNEQKDKWLYPMVRGEIYPSVGLTEPEVAGSDPTLIQSNAYLDGDEWVINAHKWFTTGANKAAFTTMFCVTEPDGERHRRASMIIVPTDTPGYEIVRVVPTMGHNSGNHCEISLTNVRVPKGNLLGERGHGFVIAQKRLGPGRIYHSMRWLGQAQRAFDLMCERSLNRFAHGSLLSEKQMIQKFIADSATEIQTARLLTFEAARKIDQGEDARVDIAMIKVYGAKVLHDVIDRAIQTHGALGVTSDTPLEKMYRDARYARIYDGPDEVHTASIARRILKRYKEGESWDPANF
ncbi:acyl-CoA dehydrogenase family protein [Alkalihalobacterium chitinilyticum]|uniref:Acyl-CoA dehydrogenase family protein n=1 Tax=Alkalihalobacterium chitinilyticum TaxID=2980103 RepID=A0ABT5VAU1_9BACI|nr:acyl-CoA dehydrogenase family protein [Alkalihalobacterium chitinilyticum]MDE5411792.1 acyl-CoA dehydrogenase family protein [Alkalihalobacterium chitinilyticum]